MKCKHCNGFGWYYNDITKTKKIKCEYCQGTGEVEMTNEYFLQTATTEQLAEFLTKVILDDKRFRMTMVGGVNETKLWLKQPHREVEE